MKRFLSLPRWFWFLLLFFALDFVSRQVYLKIKAEGTSKKTQIVAEPVRSPEGDIPPEDPQLLGAAEDGSHPFYHHGLRAMRRTEENWRGRSYTEFTNQLGFRDREIRNVSLKKQHRRIILIGDTNIYGVGLDWDQTLAGLLEKRFSGLEILNAAVPSYCPTSEESKLRYLMGQHGLEADVVILFLDVADVDDELSYGRQADGSTEFRVGQFSELPGNKNWADHLEKFLQERIEKNLTLTGALVRNVRQWVRRHVAWFGVMAYEKGRWPEYDGPLNSLIDEGILRAASSLTRLNEFLKSRNTSLILVVSPGSSQMDLLDPKSRALTIWEAWGQANDVPVLSLFPIFYEHAMEYPSLVQGSGHWNEKGHALVADELAKQIPSKLPWANSP